MSDMTAFRITYDGPALETSDFFSNIRDIFASDNASAIANAGYIPAVLGLALLRDIAVREATQNARAA
jgi:hypothetical protein